MVQLCLQLTVAPDRIQEAIQTLRVVMRPARLDRECAGATLSTSVENPTILCYTEDWQTPEPLIREMRSSRFTRLLEVMESATDTPKLEIRFISEIRGLDYVEAQCAIRP
jgi:hypothetical protein